MPLPREVIPGRFYMITRRDARAAGLGGAEVSFPIGTYWLRRFAHVPLSS